ncbi:MAG: HAD-IA family hydrolase [Coriobacteriia bacterium]|nr:HAD-IA family hydrolase [Coriobacteriia bacterium]
MPKILAILFDLDGTLIDSEEHILTSYRYATKKVLGYSPPNEVMRDLIGIPLIEQMRIISSEHADELFRVYREYNQLSYSELIKPFPGTTDTLNELKEAGYRIGVVTSKMCSSALRDLALFDLIDTFELIQGSDKTELHKPHPEPLLFAAETLGLAPEQCAYVGDSPYDMQAARAANMLAIAASWGMFARERLLEAGAQLEARSITELPALFS